MTCQEAEFFGEVKIAFACIFVKFVKTLLKIKKVCAVEIFFKGIVYLGIILIVCYERLF